MARWHTHRRPDQKIKPADPVSPDPVQQRVEQLDALIFRATAMVEYLGHLVFNPQARGLVGRLDRTAQLTMQRLLAEKGSHVIRQLPEAILADLADRLADRTTNDTQVLNWLKSTDEGTHVARTTFYRFSARFHRKRCQLIETLMFEAQELDPETGMPYFVPTP